MRPVRLEVEGFTAFREATTVEFDGVDLFAFTGPTGSGKTSLLDAMVFALYGSVPRLADQRRVVEVVAQGMAEARVRLDFTIGEHEYTATRIVRRTKGGGGTTAEARLESGGEVLAGNADEVTTQINARLGLTYEHFTKCVVLPQGEFARFLHDTPAVRQDLLISLLDLGVYADMADLAGKRASAAKSEMAVLEGRSADLGNATPDAIAAAAMQVEQLETLIADLDATTPELASLATDADSTAQALIRTSDEIELLAGIVVPSGIDELHERVVNATAALEETNAALVAAEKAVAAAGDKTELTQLADLHERLATLTERREKANTLAAERKSDVDAAAATLADAKAKLDAVAVANHAHAVRSGLVVGDECPVCLQTVANVPAVTAPPALTKAQREHQAAADAHAAAAKALAAAEASVVQFDTDLDELRGRLTDAPAAAEVKRLLKAHAKAATELDEQRVAHAGATATHAKAVAAEHGARELYDEARDSVAPLKPPARRRSASLLEEWTALGDWAQTETKRRVSTVRDLEKKASGIEAQRKKLLSALAIKCAAAQLELPSGSDPSAAASQALGRAKADHDTLVERAADADKLRASAAEVESRGALARGLATHLDARHFEKWLLDEAMAALADGATELLRTLSGDQYSLRVDSKSGTFVVVDHRNADEVRAARTLSGGETFLASLALALALADRITTLAARGSARLESIFLDEGFGTLDPDTLDMVASAIEELGASGRMVGVVSHVTELAERLPVRYEVTRAGNASTVERIDR